MVDMMKQISKTFFEVLSQIVAIAIFIGCGLLYILLIFTIPIWIVPFRIWSRRQSKRE